MSELKVEMGSKLQVRLDQRAAQYFDQQAVAYWNERNAKRYSMAPTHLVETGRMDDEKYHNECAKYSCVADAQVRYLLGWFSGGLMP